MWLQLWNTRFQSGTRSLLSALDRPRFVRFLQCSWREWKEEFAEDGHRSLSEGPAPAKCFWCPRWETALLPPQRCRTSIWNWSQILGSWRNGTDLVRTIWRKVKLTFGFTLSARGCLGRFSWHVYGSGMFKDLPSGSVTYLKFIITFLTVFCSEVCAFFNVQKFSLYLAFLFHFLREAVTQARLWEPPALLLSAGVSSTPCCALL